jgi:hypothetical protein
MKYEKIIDARFIMVLFDESVGTKLGAVFCYKRFNR